MKGDLLSRLSGTFIQLNKIEEIKQRALIDNVQTPLNNLLKQEIIAAQSQKRKQEAKSKQNKNDSIVQDTSNELFNCTEKCEQVLLQSMCSIFEQQYNQIELENKLFRRLLPELIKYRIVAEIKALKEEGTKFQIGSRMEVPENQIIKKGQLEKKGAIRRNWTSRWFILKSRYLFYFNNKNDLLLKGFIRLENCSVQLSPNKKKPNCLAICTALRTFLISAPSESECNEWLRAIKNSSVEEEIKRLEETHKIQLETLSHTQAQEYLERFLRDDSHEQKEENLDNKIENSFEEKKLETSEDKQEEEEQRSSHENPHRREELLAQVSEEPKKKRKKVARAGDKKGKSRKKNVASSGEHVVTLQKKKRKKKEKATPTTDELKDSNEDIDSKSSSLVSSNEANQIHEAKEDLINESKQEEKEEEVEEGGEEREEEREEEEEGENREVVEIIKSGRSSAVLPNLPVDELPVAPIPGHENEKIESKNESQSDDDDNNEVYDESEDDYEDDGLETFGKTLPGRSRASTALALLNASLAGDSDDSDDNHDSSSENEEENQENKTTNDENNDSNPMNEEESKEEASISINTDILYKQGYLMKKGAKRRNWTTRWFILSYNRLAYYKNPGVCF